MNNVYVCVCIRLPGKSLENLFQSDNNMFLQALAQPFGVSLVAEYNNIYWLLASVSGYNVVFERIDVNRS